MKPKELQISFHIIFISSIFMLIISFNNYMVFAQVTEPIAMKNQNNNSRPILSVNAFCMVAQVDIPGEFVASGFKPNSEVIIETNKNNFTGKLPSEPVTVLLTKSTDSVGNITGEFVLNTHIQQPSSYRDYFLHVYDPNVPEDSATASLDIC